MCKSPICWYITRCFQNIKYHQDSSGSISQDVFQKIIMFSYFEDLYIKPCVTKVQFFPKSLRSQPPRILSSESSQCRRWYGMKRADDQGWSKVGWSLWRVTLAVFFWFYLDKFTFVKQYCRIHHLQMYLGGITHQLIWVVYYCLANMKRTDPVAFTVTLRMQDAVSCQDIIREIAKKYCIYAVFSCFRVQSFQGLGF